MCGQIFAVSTGVETPVEIRGAGMERRIARLGRDQSVVSLSLRGAQKRIKAMAAIGISSWRNGAREPKIPPKSGRFH